MRTNSPLYFFRAPMKWLWLLGFLVTTIHVKAQSWSNVNGFGSTDADAARGVCTDASGNVYYIGSFFNTVDFDPGAGTTSLISAGGTDVVVSKFNAAGVFQWAVRAGGVNNEAGVGIATNGTDVFITGTYVGLASFGSTNLNSTGGNTDVFVARLSVATGAFTWAVSIGGAAGDAVFNICLDGSNNPCIIGTFFTTITIGATTLNATGGAGGDTFIAKLSGSNGAAIWANGGGSSNAGDNGGNNAGICYVPGTDEIVAVCTFNTNNATYGGITVPGGAGTGNNLALLEMNAGTGAMLAAIGLNGTGNEEGFAVCYDASTQDVILTGYFDGATATFGSTVLTNGGDDDIFVARYSISSNTFVWAVKPAAGGTGQDRGFGICSNGLGQVFLTGQYKTSITFGSTVLAATGAAADLFVAGLSAADGAWLWALKAGSNDASLDEAGRGVSAGGPSGKIAVTGNFASIATFGALPTITSAGDNDIFIAQIASPLTASVAGTNATCVNGCNGSATVTASGGTGPYTYAWSPSGGSAATATGLCVGTYTVTINDNAGGSIQRNVVIGLPATQLATAATNNTTFVVNASNTNIYDASCNLIATVQPIGGATQVTGTVTARVWFEGGAPVYAPTGQVYVSRHYEIQPATSATTATARITLYFTQAEFNAYNSVSTLDLPTGPTDNARKANLFVTKLNGVSNNGTGLPGTYTNGGTLIDPVDGDIVWNATALRWEVSFNVAGFSGFFVSTSSTALPLTWLDLKASLDAAGHTVIDWKVDERQVTTYTIEKSVNGGSFAAIATIPSTGDGEHTYSFREQQELTGTATYRIKQTDLDGRFTWSRSLLVKANRNDRITLYPNPVKQTATLNITDPALMNTTALLVDGAGRIVQRIPVRQSITTIDMKASRPGIYTLRLHDGTNIKLLRE